MPDPLTVRNYRTSGSQNHLTYSGRLTACVAVAILWCSDDEALNYYTAINEIFLPIHSFISNVEIPYRYKLSQSTNFNGEPTA